MEILRGDIYFVENRNFGIGFNSGISGSRPAVIVSNDVGNKHSDFVEVVFLTSKRKKPLPTHVDVICQVPSSALCEQVQTINKNKLGTYVRSCTEKEMKRIDFALKISLGLVDDWHSEDTEEDHTALDTGRKAFEDIIKEQAAEIAKLKSEKEMLKELYNQLLEKAVG